MKTTKKRSALSLMGMAALVLAFGLVLAGCATLLFKAADKTVPPELLGTWYYDEACTEIAYEFVEGNKVFDKRPGTVGAPKNGMDFTVTVDTGTVWLYFGPVTSKLIDNYKLEGNKITGTEFVNVDEPRKATYWIKRMETQDGTLTDSTQTE
jgi:hypothetical protein